MNDATHYNRALTTEIFVSAFINFLLFGLAFLGEFKVAAFASAVLVIAYFLYLVYARPHFYFKYFAYLLFIGMNLVGEFCVEFSNFALVELGTNAHFVGAFPLLAFSRCLFILALQLLEIKKGEISIRSAPTANRKVLIESKFFINAGAVLVLIGVVLCQVDVLSQGSAMSQNMDRFVYESTYGEGSFPFISNNLGVLMIFPLAALRRGNRGIGASGLLLYCFYLVWVGNKFGSFVTIISLALLVFYDWFLQISIQKIRSFFFAAIAAVLVLICAASLIQSSIQGTTPINYLGQRLAQQGQLWWKTYENSGGELHASELSDEFRGQISSSSAVKENVGSSFGIYKVMYYCAPTAVIDAKLKTNAAYSEASYAAVYYYFGAAGPVIFSLLMAGLVYWIQNAFINAVNKNRLISAILLARFIAIARDGITMFLFTNFFNKSSLLSYAWLAIVNLNDCRSKRKTRVEKRFNRGSSDSTSERQE